MQRMSEFEIIKEDYAGVSDNSVFQLEKLEKRLIPILDFKELCPSGFTFLERHEKIVKQYIEYWKSSEGDMLNLGSIFQ